jgi:hypothetical protein
VLLAITNVISLGYLRVLQTRVSEARP